MELALSKFESEPILVPLVMKYRNKKVKPTLIELLPIAQQIMKKALDSKELPNTEVDYALIETDNLIIYHEESNLYIKLIPKELEFKFKMELKAMELVKNYLVNIIPVLIASGCENEYHYIVTKECKLSSGECPISMHTLEREQLPLINFEHLTQWTASILSILHQTPCENVYGVDFILKMTKLAENAQQKHKKFNFLPKELIDAIPELLAKYKFQKKDLQLGIVHGDFTMGNILGSFHNSTNEYTSEFKPSNLIDFGDAFIGLVDPMWDITTVFVDLFRMDCKRLEEFLDNYGKSIKNLTYKEFKLAILVYMVLFPSECISREFCKALFVEKGCWTKSITWDWVESQIFPLEDFRH